MAAKPSWCRRFLESLAQHGNVAAAARAAGITRQCAYLARRRDPAFAEAWDAAADAAVDALELAARRLALGDPEPVLDAEGNPVIGPDGEPVEVPTEFGKASDRALIELLKANRPPKYKELSCAAVERELARLVAELAARLPR